MCRKKRSPMWLEQSKKDTRCKCRGSQGPKPFTLFSMVSPSPSKPGGAGGGTKKKKWERGQEFMKKKNSMAHFSEFSCGWGVRIYTHTTESKYSLILVLSPAQKEKHWCEKRQRLMGSLFCPSLYKNEQTRPKYASCPSQQNTSCSPLSPTLLICKNK